MKKSYDLGPSEKKFLTDYANELKSVSNDYYFFQSETMEYIYFKELFKCI